MKKYKCVLFDLDGTLANTFPGILHSYQHAARMTGYAIPTEKVVGELIGAHLASVFKDTFKLDDERAKIALDHYRDYYAREGLHEAELYENMDVTLKSLKDKGYFVAVTTLKKETFAKVMLEDLGVAKYFDVIIGMDDKDGLTKAGMLEKAMNIAGASERETVLVGDSSFDERGAVETGTDFIAAAYGFGYKTVDEAKETKSVAVIEKPMDLLDIL